MTERWISDEDEPLLIVDSKGEYESISVLYREDTQTVRDLLNDYDEKYIDEFSLRETVQLELQRVEEENVQLKSKLFDCNLELEHNKESVDDAYWELTKIKKENDDLKKGILKDIFADECEVYKKENEQLKAQLQKGEDVCSICKHQYLTKRDTDKYYIAKCKKEHPECSKDTVNYCEDFECKEVTE